MSRIELSFDVPDDLDPAYVYNCLTSFYHDLVAKHRKVWRDGMMWEQILASDEVMEKFAAGELDHGVRPARVVRALTYRTINPLQELPDVPHEHRGDPRRPVLMRGSHFLLKHKYPAMSEYAEYVVDRYLRRIKFTSLDAVEIDRAAQDVLRRTSYPHFRGYHPGAGSVVFIGGEPHRLSDEERRRLKGLYALTKKFEALEGKIEAGGHDDGPDCRHHERRSQVHRGMPGAKPGQLGLSPKEASAITGICLRKIREAIQAGALPARRLGSRRHVIMRPDVEAYVQNLPLARAEARS